ncbi:hypothetical protein FM076_25825 [Streptomyces albus subsp. chlorinus]|uniref:hypothetical protein n=1 Tax=Streptomyces albus TaxID=1888 RepID=UPI00156F083B|nr:hypothetical protein [Streptomyces albus]NSC24384.1 hypothetical protein [Streptomyces albus subsp. chlorinus]
MRKLRPALTVAGAVLTGLVLSGGSASAASGDVVVFQTELQRLTHFENPRGCHKLPAGAHVLTNRTDKPVTIYADPFCATPGLTVQPDHGSHVAPGSGSFSA